MTKSRPHSGSCLCGQIKFEADGFTPQTAHCHCSMCRKFHGAAFSTFGEVRLSSFRWLNGTELLSTYIAKNGTVRQFCSICGSSLTFKSARHIDSIEVAIAALDTKLDIQPDAHIHVASKVSWLNLNDDLPAHIGDRNK